MGIKVCGAQRGGRENMSLSMNIVHPGFRIESPLTLGPEDVHLWRVDLEATSGGVPQWLPILSPDERTRASRFHRASDRHYFIAGRAILRQILGAYLDADPKTLNFAYSEKSKPALGEAHAGSNLTFNISHSGTIALLAFARSRQLGVDVEQVRRDFDTAPIAARFFSQVEQEELATLPADQRNEAFFLCWTRKEAYIKATGEGLSLPLRQFDVSLAPRAENVLLATRPDPLECSRWSLRDIPVEAGYAAALCVSGTGWQLVQWSEESPEPIE
jgi:4'-phosphopantetheinyl transferase